MRLLALIQVFLENQPSIRAAWLAGSRGRGTDDDLSDIDIWVAAEDDAIGRINADPLAFVHQIAPTLMHIQAPSIAPPGGSFLLTWVAVGSGFEQVDWYWVPVSAASRPSQTRLLFERRSVPIIDPLQSNRLDDVALVREIDGTIDDVLLMIANAWKHALRDAPWRMVAQIQHVNDCLAKLDWFVSHGREPEFHDPKRSFLPETIPVGREDTGAVLQQLLGDLVHLSDRANRAHCYRDAFAAMKRSLSG
ncbi:MAG TPA: nucleotidyltransferase domain-containing protein [Thermomicrobiales bacterium]|nr:nucleotidyltransferase domain-containing protein [Thermomicrobiales bacterium]